MPVVSIRLATPADEDIVAEFNRRLAAESENKQLDPETVRLGVREILGNPRRGRYFVACVGERVVGQMMHTFEWSDWRNGEIWWLQSVYVHPDFRRRGVFGALLGHIQSEAACSPHVVGLRLYVEEHNAVARAAYERSGMRLAGYAVMEWSKPV